MAESPIGPNTPWVTMAISVATALGLQGIFAAWWRARAKRQDQDDTDRRLETADIRALLAEELMAERAESAKLRVEYDAFALQTRLEIQALQTDNADCKGELRAMKVKLENAEGKATKAESLVGALQSQVRALMDEVTLLRTGYPALRTGPEQLATAVAAATTKPPPAAVLAEPSAESPYPVVEALAEEGARIVKQAGEAGALEALKHEEPK